jgi:hypothetical protein
LKAPGVTVLCVNFLSLIHEIADRLTAPKWIKAGTLLYSTCKG